MSRWLVGVALLAATLLAPAPAALAQGATDAACDRASAPYAQFQVAGSPRVSLELARTPQEHELGLMYRTALDADSGMLFIYQTESREGYWMYHTLIPLTIGWLDRTGTVVDIKDMPRLSDPNDVSDASRHVYNLDPAAAAYLYALEVNPGWFARHGVSVGSRMTLCVASPDAAPVTGANQCAAGVEPLYAQGFATLRSAVGEAMGSARTCEYADPNGTGDVEQDTSSGLAFWRKCTNTPTFTDGYQHWALTPSGLVTWTGSAVDPAGTTCPR